mmetsp:Transcript_27227/g.85024  ORF Transcript_27227/g.85024 Transcript_27227/m.85024 type:complete len:246 (-) Transcript_27227:341-1078(-)
MRRLLPRWRPCATHTAPRSKRSTRPTWTWSLPRAQATKKKSDVVHGVAESAAHTWGCRPALISRNHTFGMASLAPQARYGGDISSPGSGPLGSSAPASPWLASHPRFNSRLARMFATLANRVCTMFLRRATMSTCCAPARRAVRALSIAKAPIPTTTTALPLKSNASARSPIPSTTGPRKSSSPGSVKCRGRCRVPVQKMTERARILSMAASAPSPPLRPGVLRWKTSTRSPSSTSTTRTTSLPQ